MDIELGEYDSRRQQQPSPPHPPPAPGQPQRYHQVPQYALSTDQIYATGGTTSPTEESPLEKGSPNVETASIQYGQVQTGWMPHILRPWSLWLFLFFYGATFVVLLGLYIKSQRAQGLTTEVESRHYLWTYGPTAVFIILAAFWRHLDYEVKMLMPWVELASGPKHAKLTVLLDYISPFQPVAFWDACKNRHWIVVIASAAFAILKIATVFATGLFVLQQTPMEIGSLDADDTDAAWLRYSTSFSSDLFDISKIDSRAAYTIYGTFDLNLTYPSGTNSEHAFQSLSNAHNRNMADIAEMTFPVDVFSASLDCQEAKLNWTSARDRNQITMLSQYFNTTATIPGCTMQNMYLDSPNWVADSVEDGFYASFQNGTCDEASDPVSGSRVLLAMTYSHRFNYTNTMDNYTALICQPSYKIQKHKVTLQGNQLNDYTRVIDLKPIDGAETRTIDGFTVKELTDTMWYGLWQGAQHISMSDWERQLDTFFSLMYISGKSTGRNYTAFFDPEVMKESANKLYGTVASQIARQHLLVPVSGEGEGVAARISQLQQRLILRNVSVIVMEVLLVMLIAITIALIIMLPKKGVAPRDPSSIGALATILSRSKGLEQTLDGTFNLTEQELEQWLHRYRFYTTVEASSSGRTFKVELVDIFPQSGKKRFSEEYQKGMNIGPDVSGVPQQHWWKPLGLKWWVIAPLIVIPAAIIVALELLYQKSVRDNGLATIPTNNYVHYSWVYVPAFAMVLLVTLFNMLDYAARCIAPYQAMKRQSTQASRSILFNPFGKLTIPALWYAIKERHITVMATTFAVLIAPILTITVSGLYSAKLHSYASTLTLHQQTWFNTTDLDMVYTPNATDDIISGLIVSGNLTYPRWTYEDLAFASVSLPEQLVAGEHPSDAVTIDLPALRMTLNCTVVPEEQYNFVSIGYPPTSFAHDSNDTTPMEDRSLSVNISTPTGCGNSGWEHLGMINLEYNMNRPAVGYAGAVLDIPADDQPDCPQFAVFYGHVDRGNITKFNTLFCSGWAQQLSVRTTLTLPDFQIDTTSSKPPVERLEDTARYFSSQSVFPGWTFGSLAVPDTADAELDSFLSAVVYGRDGVPLDELLIPERLQWGVQRLYGVTATQTMSQDQRIPLLSESGGDAGARIIKGQSRTTPIARLVQNELSTRILEALLAFIIVMTVVAYVGVKARELLPRESNSIATIGGYLAGSDVLELVPEGAEWDGYGREGKRRSVTWGSVTGQGTGGLGRGDGRDSKGKVFAGYVFGFGWWDDLRGDEEGRRGRRRYGVGIGRRL